VTFRLEQGNPTTQGVFAAGMNAITLSLQSYVKVLTYMSKLKATLVGRELKRLTVKDKLKQADEKQTLKTLR